MDFRQWNLNLLYAIIILQLWVRLFILAIVLEVPFQLKSL